MKLGVAKKRTVVARLQAAGIPIPLENDSDTKPDLLVESLKGSLAFDLKMGSEYLLNLRISNHSYGNLMVKELRGHLLEGDSELTFQSDPTEHDPERKTYRMLSGGYVCRKSVLNHRLADELAPGASIGGKLLALSITERIPGEYPHGLVIPVELILTDQYGRKHRSVVGASVDRTATMPKPKVFSRVAGSLYHGSPQPSEFDHTFKTRQTIESENGVERAEKQSDPMKRLTALLQRSDVDAMLDE